MCRLPLILLSLVFLACSSSNNETLSEELTYNLIEEQVDDYNKAGFEKGFWIKKKSLDIIAEGDVNFNVAWQYLKTYTKQNQPYMFIQDPLDGIEYKMERGERDFWLYQEQDSIILEELAFFTDSGLYFGNDQYVKVDSAMVVYDYFFAGEYKVDDYSKTIALDRNLSVVGWPEATSYQAHYEFEKPVFVALNNDKIVDTFYLQDCDGGFQLFDIKNKNDLGSPNSPVEIGELKHTFLKI